MNAKLPEDVVETSAAHAVDEANVALTRSELESEEAGRRDYRASRERGLPPR